MSFNPSVKLTRLYECTSKKGTVYLRGRLGYANVVILKSDDVSESGQPIWNVLVQEPERRVETDGVRTDPHPKETEAAAARGYERELNDGIPF